MPHKVTSQQVVVRQLLWEIQEGVPNCHTVVVGCAGASKTLIQSRVRDLNVPRATRGRNPKRVSPVLDVDGFGATHLSGDWRR
eukprot:CAMPEP_0194508422 /NCGR_PEP_ID=MMETSP0253-20130528/38628_1 /TAXON_ID=2966 /ORGANISM="Noctiluca scintillans" /LENGTH=82 /DNA_ID=CAMNT_0039351459 /DNA_START=104 /DNA_END=348 /DNA_ORIENTATION=+